MRHLILALMIALLPVRGWVGSAMATTALPVTSAAAPATVMPADCPMHAAAGADADGTALHAAQPDPAGCTVCDTCELCLSVLTVGVPPAADATPVARTLPGSAPSRFASAEPGPGFKPPIS